MICLNNIYDSVMKYLCIYYGVIELNFKLVYLLEIKYLGGFFLGKVQFLFCLVNVLIWSRFYVLMCLVLLDVCSYVFFFFLSEIFFYGFGFVYIGNIFECYKEQRI